MHRVFCSRWVLSGLSLTAGIGIGATLTAARDTSHRGGLLDRVPVIPIPSVDAASEINTYQPGQVAVSKSTAVMKYGFPSLSNIKSRESYVTSYDPRNRTAAWVIEQLNVETITGTSDRKFCDFKEDDSVHVYHRSSNADYKGSGFDRGHLAAAANHKWSQKAMDDTFYLSNVSPQVSWNSTGSQSLYNSGDEHLEVELKWNKFRSLDYINSQGLKCRL